MEVVGAMMGAMMGELAKTVNEEARYAFLFSHHLELMKEKLCGLRILLENNYSHQIVKDNLATLRNLMYEADDIITDCRIRQEYQTPNSKSCPFNFFFRLPTGKKIEAIHKRMQQMEDILKAHLTVQATRSNYDHEFERSARTTTSDLQASNIIGLHEDVEKIKSWMKNPSSKLEKIAIVGMGGLGKTTIAKLIYNDTQVRDLFQTKIWLSVSQTIKPEEIRRSILQAARRESSSSVSESQISLAVIRLLEEMSCLIILDDLWDKNIEWWISFLTGLPASTCKQCCIIVTTRIKDVASKLLVDESRTHSPRVLNGDESWLLFSKHAFAKIGHLDNSTSQTFEKEGRKVVAECGGLPLAIKTIGGLLGVEASLDKWKSICNKFCVPKTTDENRFVKTTLRMSYEALPPHLKLCLLSFSIFPEDYEVQAERIIHWWVGEGLVQRTESESAKELAFRYLCNLVNRCLVEVSNLEGCNGRIYSCKMHDLVRDLTIEITTEETICSFEDDGSQNLTADTRWLGSISAEKAGSLVECTKLRAFLPMRTSDLAPQGNNLCSLPSLRSLDLSYSKLDSMDGVKNLWSWITCLERLAYLNLSGARGLEEVPKSIRKLRNLQILILNGCINLSKLNPAVTYLKKLIVLDLSSCDKLKYLPGGLGNLSKLQELSGLRLVSGAKSRGCALGEIGELRELRELRIRLGKECDVTGKGWDVLSELKKLELLAIDFENCKGNSTKEMVDQIYPPSGIKEMYLRQYSYPKLPQLFTPQNLPNLACLRIEESHLEGICMRSPGNSWNIEHICLNALPRLKEDWEELRKEMPLLSYAEVSNCFLLSNYPYPMDIKPVIWRK